MIVATLSVTAFGWDCKTAGCGCDWADGSQLTYHINVNDFSVAGATAIEAAADAWDAGGTELNRGAEWDFIRGSDITVDGVNGNWTNEVYKRPNDFFSGFGFNDAVGMTLTSHLLCGRRDTDVVFNEQYIYTVSMPSARPVGTDYAIGTAALHEFGHALGLDHYDGGSATNIAVMNQKGGFADISAHYRINEDDYLGLVAAKPGPSTGKNVMLQKFWKWNIIPLEIWTDDNITYEGDWEGCPGQVIAATNGPHEVLAIIVGTSVRTPLVEWRLSSDRTCFSGTEYTLGTRNPTIGSDEPYPITPNGGYAIPSNIPLGEYYLCAKIDPYDDLPETSDDDNAVISDMTFEVHSCP